MVLNNLFARLNKLCNHSTVFINCERCQYNLLLTYLYYFEAAKYLLITGGTPSWNTELMAPAFVPLTSQFYCVVRPYI